ncbi:MAG: hypothetical protein JRC91_12475 [Deltaproteobacteria bacterium]|nr:hypothetical protein [Deltaproteobacteria bacterium]
MTILFFMKVLKKILSVVLAFFCFSGIAYARCQIQFDSEADRVMHLGGNTLRGNFATPEECDAYWRSRPTFEQNHSKCVGCDDQNYSQPLQNRRRNARDSSGRWQKQKEETERQEMIRQQKLREEQSRVEFERGKREMLSGLKGGSGGGDLQLKGGETKLGLKSGNVPANNPCAGREKELQQAQQRLTELRDDVKTMQIALQLYRDGLLRHVSSLNRQSREIEDISDKILIDGIKYLRDSATGDFLKARFKFKNKDQYKKYENFIELIEQLKTEKDLLSWLNNSSKDTTKLIEGADLLAGTVVPGWEHVKMNIRVWSDVGKECVAWLKINRLKRETEDYSMEISAISLRLKMKVEKINSLKQCMAESTAGCIQKCPQ